MFDWEDISNRVLGDLLSQGSHGLILIVWLLVAGVFGILLYIFYPAFESFLFRQEGLISRIERLDLTKSDDRQSNDGTILLSVIIPAFNEEKRLVKMLEVAESYLSKEVCLGLDLLVQAYNKKTLGKEGEQRQIDTMVEWIVVDDGSTDQTCTVYESFVRKQQQEQQGSTRDGKKRMSWGLCRLSKNCGKGAAVQTGMLLAKGFYRLMVDADGATEFGLGLEAVARYIDNYPFVFGSRSAAKNNNNNTTKDDDDTTIFEQQRSWSRKFLQLVFHFLVVIVVGDSKVMDTQCGFKLFQGQFVAPLFALHLHRWAFDIELFVRSGYLNLLRKEVPVPWQEIEGSKLNTSTFNLIKVAIGMLRDMVCVKLCYTLGIWKISSSGDSKKER